jgi:hypothetical protein
VLPLVDHHLAAAYAIAFGLSAGAVFFNPAPASVLPIIVDEQELAAASSGLWSAAVVSQIALAPLAGALVAALGVAPAFGLNAASFAISATILTALHPAGAQRLAGAGSWIRRIRDGTRLLAADRLLRPLAAVQLLAALSAGATSALLVILAERHLGTGSDGFGLQLGAIGVGAALGPLLLARLTSNPRRPALVFSPTCCAASWMSSWLPPGTCLLPAPSRGRLFAGFDMIWQTGRLMVLGDRRAGRRRPRHPGRLPDWRRPALARGHHRPDRATGSQRHPLQSLNRRSKPAHRRLTGPDPGRGTFRIRTPGLPVVSADLTSPPSATPHRARLVTLAAHSEHTYLLPMSCPSSS